MSGESSVSTADSPIKGPSCQDLQRWPFSPFSTLRLWFGDTASCSWISLFPIKPHLPSQSLLMTSRSEVFGVAPISFASQVAFQFISHGFKDNPGAHDFPSAFSASSLCPSQSSIPSVPSMWRFENTWKLAFQQMYIILPSGLLLGILDTENNSQLPNCPAISSRGVHSTLLPYLISNQYSSSCFLSTFWFVHSRQLLPSLFWSSLPSLLPNLIIDHLLVGLPATRINRNN